MKKFVAVVAILGAFALGACGGDDDGGADPGVVDFLVEQGETQESAECFAKELSKYSLSDFQDLVDAEGPEDIDDDFFTDVDRVGETVCADL